MKNLLLISLCLCCVACSVHPYKKLDKGTTYILKKEDLRSVVADTTTFFLFKSALSYKEHHFGGNLVIKAKGADNYRIVLMTEMGMKIFDFEFTPTDFIVHHCIDALNRKIVLRIIENDMRLVLMNNIVGKKVTLLKNEAADSEVYKIKVGKRTHYYEKDLSRGRLQQIVQRSIRGNRVLVNFDYSESDVPKTILVSHYKMDLNMRLDLLKH